jgi:prepilin-type processing-associated H-X9-DG protein
MADLESNKVRLICINWRTLSEGADTIVAIFVEGADTINAVFVDGSVKVDTVL